MKAILGGKKLTSKETARLLGVSEASVKRWADGGLLPAEKTAGGHRRFRPEDVAAFRRESFNQDEVARYAPDRESPGRALDPASSGELPNGEALAQTLYEALVAARAEEASRLVVSLYLQGWGVGAIADAVLSPAMRKVGDLWHLGELSVAEEHVATRAAHTALEALRGAHSHPHGGVTNLTALCCSVEEDYHELPVRMAALTLEAAGWAVVNLGTSTPFYAAAEAVARFTPRLVCVASTILTHFDRAAREYTDFRKSVARTGARVVLGGAGFAGESVRRRFPADLHAENFIELEGFAAEIALADRDAQAGGASAMPNS